MNNTSNHRLLIISNSVMSRTRANGKTIYSFFDHLPKEFVRQLYFLKESPTIAGYKYFQITDEDIIKGVFKSKNRGTEYTSVEEREISDFVSRSSKVKKPLYRLMRELLWKNKWQSKHLDDWLDEFKPTDVFFVAGDSCFAYDICEYIVERYNARLSVYITDDYIMERGHESFFAAIRRKKVFEKMHTCVERADGFFTICEPMRQAYKKMLGKDSELIVNIPDPAIESNKPQRGSKIKLVYAGSLYYGREDIIEKIVNCIKEYNAQHESKGFLCVYTNTPLEKDQLNKICIDDCSLYGGSLSKEAVIKELVSADILVFVESFDAEQVEKTRFSLSTKVPEYLSMKKPILAVGPEQIGSMDYLKNVAICVNDINQLSKSLERLMDNKELRDVYSVKAYDKYVRNHDKELTQKRIERIVFGESET